MYEVARKCFVSLNKDFVDWKGIQVYYVLNDNNFVTAFMAESDEKAIEMFMSGKY